MKKRFRVLRVLFPLVLAVICLSALPIPIGSEDCPALLDTMWGDADGDGTITLIDLSHLAQYLANFDQSTGTSSVPLSRGGDCNGDGVVNLLDLSTLAAYLANYDETTGQSSVVLGPESLAHRYDAVVVPPTCTERGYTSHTCAVCGDSYLDSYVNALGHNYVDRVCTRCGAYQPSQGLVFVSNGDGTCTVADVGACADPMIVIPSTSPAGDTVTAVGAGAFGYCRSVTGVVIPEGVTTIGKFAFRGCESLVSVSLPDTLTGIGDSAFKYCVNLSEINLPDGVIVGTDAFYGCTALTGEAIPEETLPTPDPGDDPAANDIF